MGKCERVGVEGGIEVFGTQAEEEFIGPALVTVVCSFEAAVDV